MLVKVDKIVPAKPIKAIAISPEKIMTAPKRVTRIFHKPDFMSQVIRQVRKNVKGK